MVYGGGLAKIVTRHHSTEVTMADQPEKPLLIVAIEKELAELKRRIEVIEALLARK